MSELTPEQRAETILWGGRALPKETRAEIAAAIRAAEDAVLERAAKKADDLEEHLRREGAAEGANGCQLAAYSIRALKEKPDA